MRPHWYATKSAAAVAAAVAMTVAVVIADYYKHKHIPYTDRVLQEQLLCGNSRKWLTQQSKRAK